MQLTLLRSEHDAEDPARAVRDQVSTWVSALDPQSTCSGRGLQVADRGRNACAWNIFMHIDDDEKRMAFA